jgi:hypothetical protein
MAPPGFRLVPIDGDSDFPIHDANQPRKRTRNDARLEADVPEHSVAGMFLYPDTKTWLEMCDSDLVRGRDSENYAQYAGPLIDKRLLRLDDIVDLRLEELQGFCVGMEVGTARRVLRFAQEDVAKLKRGRRLTVL